jgi:hypothetical protein
VIRHQNNIEAKLARSEETPELREEGTYLQIVSVCSNPGDDSLWRRMLREAGGKGSFGGEAAEVKKFALVGAWIGLA